MGYTIVDLINKVVNIEIKRRGIYENIAEENSDIQFLKIMSIVLIKEIDTTIRFHEELKIQIGDVEFEEIDFWIYDKMSFLINEFNKRIFIVEISNVREYLKFSLDLEKDTYSVLIDLQGRFLENARDIERKTYKILSEIINNKAKHIVSLEMTLKKL